MFTGRSRQQDVRRTDLSALRDAALSIRARSESTAAAFLGGDVKVSLSSSAVSRGRAARVSRDAAMWRPGFAASVKQLQNAADQKCAAHSICCRLWCTYRRWGGDSEVICVCTCVREERVRACERVCTYRSVHDPRNMWTCGDPVERRQLQDNERGQASRLGAACVDRDTRTCQRRGHKGHVVQEDFLFFLLKEQLKSNSSRKGSVEKEHLGDRVKFSNNWI